MISVLGHLFALGCAVLSWVLVCFVSFLRFVFGLWQCCRVCLSGWLSVWMSAWILDFGFKREFEVKGGLEVRMVVGLE